MPALLLAVLTACVLQQFFAENGLFDSFAAKKIGGKIIFWLETRATFTC